MAARKKRRNRARAERRRRARSHLMAAGKVIEAQCKVQRGTSTPTKKANARHRCSKLVQRAKQKRRRHQAVNRRIWQELRTTTQKWEDPETPAAQPINVQLGEVNERPIDRKSSVQDAPTQPWVAVGKQYHRLCPQGGKIRGRRFIIKNKNTNLGKDIRCLGGFWCVQKLCLP